MKPPLKTPCDDCPFRKGSLRGYTGPHGSGAELASIVFGDGFYPCHTAVNAERARGKATDKAFDNAPPCAGACSMANNSAKLSRCARMREGQDAVGKREDVFKNPGEMEAWHDEIPDPRTD